MRLSSTGLDLLKRRTGLTLDARQDPAGLWFIGYGHYGDVHAGMTITQAEAEAKLEHEIGRHETQLAGMLEVPVSQGQWDALLLLVFDYGLIRVRSSILIRHVNAGAIDRAAEEFLKWIQVRGRPDMQMARRRAIEREMFLQGSQFA
ncbi:lysozyme [Pseudomonas sp. 5P_5.1_Bac1]|uniref:lysozyme n=1 Tax=Pseudomonas sp. 5P_5.1_Bac1 TaxID=2971616 RepID=UPI0021C7F3DA|nr:lysozyme [Pseudomonas sp. 5P_5.1_Bac1]MCU1720220.1 lysozyme [Pseudomonas sp. 5P_5.1_Bac1]